MPPVSQLVDWILERGAHAESPRAGLLEQFLDVDVGFFGAVEFEQLRRLEAEHAGDDGVGKLLDAHVVDVDGFVIELAAVGDCVLEPGDAALQLQESLVGLEVRVGFGDREQVAEAGAQPGLGGSQRARCSAIRAR